MTHQRSGDELLGILGALANPHRLRIVAALLKRESYVSELARELQMSRPLMHMHLAKLEEAGLVRSRHEVSADGKALRYFSVVDFEEHLTPRSIAEAVETLTGHDEDRKASK